ncbi:MAG: 4a-hydroxytetrahydrobiopterin dehydratase [Calditrichaceae bacterium]
MEKFSDSEITHRLKELNNWYLDTEAIRKDWQFKDFIEAMTFINRIAELSEHHNHHPEIFNVYNKVSLRFSTHDAGGITVKDVKIAADIDKIS